MGPKPFWRIALTGDSPIARELPSADAEQARGVRVRAPLMLMLLLALALAFGFVPALEDRTPRRGSFALPPASRSEAPPRREVDKKRRTRAAPAPAVEEKSPVPAGQPQAAPETGPPAEPAAAPPADPTPLPQLPQVSELVEDVNVLLSGLPAPANSGGG
jgi:hypothetical protein